jgi:hypothetical protein
MRNRVFFCASSTIAGKNSKNPVSGGDEKPGFYQETRFLGIKPILTDIL